MADPRTAGETGRPDDRNQYLSELNVQHLRQLLLVSSEINSTLEIVDLLPRILHVVLDTLEAEAASIWIVDGDILRCEEAEGGMDQLIEGLELPLGAGFVGDVVRKGEPVLVSDASSDPRFLHQVDEATGFATRSVMAVPLIVRGETVGALEVLNKRTGSGHFEKIDLAFLTALADDAAAAVRNAKALAAERKARDLKALLEVSHEITSTFDVDRVVLSLVNLAGRAIPFQRCILGLHQEETLRIAGISGETTIDRKAAAVRDLERFLLWAAERGRELQIVDLSDDDDDDAREIRSKFPGYLEQSGAGSLLALPVADSEGRIGLLLFEFARADGFGEWEREAAGLLANEAALALRNAQLYANVPFISWLEPLAERKARLATIPGATWMRYGAVAMAVLLALVLIRLPLRVSAAEAEIRAAVQRPARATVGGVIDLISVREGHRVERGEAIARVLDEELLRRVRDAEGAFQLARREELSAEARGDAAAASMARIRRSERASTVELLRRQADASWVLAPASGVVLTRRLEERLGSYVPPGAPVAWVGDPEWVEVELLVPQKEIGEVRLGDRVRARVSAHPTVTFRGEVTEIAPGAVDLNGDAVFAVRAILDNSDGLLLPGMEARARVHTRSRPLGWLIVRRPWRWTRMNLWW